MVVVECYANKVRWHSQVWVLGAPVPSIMSVRKVKIRVDSITGLIIISKPSSIAQLAERAAVNC